MVDVRVEVGDIARYSANAIVVNLFEGVTSPGGGTGAVDRAMDGAISRLIAEGDIKGKKGEITLIHTFGRIPASKVIVLGLGKAQDLTIDRVRDLSADVARYLRRAGVQTAATITHGAGIAGLNPELCAQAIAEATVMGLYRFTRHKTRQDEDENDLKDLVLVEFDNYKVEALRRGVEKGRALAEATNFARDMANEPANHLTPTIMAERAQAMASECGLECEVYDRDWAERMGMGSFLSVAQGSVQPPKFIVVRYRGDPEGPPGLALIGKGITFDTGGISIKPAQGMEEMKGDMSGGAACIAAMQAIAKLKPRINVTAIVPATENMPSGSATKPGDVFRAMSGKTIEVVNTDAEGRLILADALAYARSLGLSPLIDVATLTGAMVVALGTIATGAMTNNQELMDKVIAAGKASGEKIWQFPMWDEYKEQIKSSVADIKNTGGREAGSITAALFLAEFAEDTPWVHLDMAGTDNSSKDNGVFVKGATGIPVRTLVNLTLALAEERQGARAK